MRGFRCLPVVAIHSEVLAPLSSFVRDCYFSGIGGQDERHRLPYEAFHLRSTIFPSRPLVALRDIAAARDKLVAQGVWLRRNNGRREWLEIAPDFRHEKGRDETSYGDETEPPVQRELHFAPTVVPAPKIAAQNCNPPREEQKRKEEIPPDSPTPAPVGRRLPPPSPEPRVLPPTGNRETSLGKKEESPERFAVDVAELQQHSLGKRLCRFLGMAQSVLEANQSGAFWLRILREQPADLADLLDQGERTRHEMPEGSTRAKFITKRIHQRKSA